jgi:hypothetical protein
MNPCFPSLETDYGCYRRQVMILRSEYREVFVMSGNACYDSVRLPVIGGCFKKRSEFRE